MHEQRKWWRNGLLGCCRSNHYSCTYISFSIKGKNSHICTNIAIILSIAFAYFINSQIKPLLSDSFFAYLLKCYFNDFMAGILICAYVNFILSISRYKFQIISLPVLLALSLVCGFVWEVVAPRYIQDSVSDVWDIVSYLLGSLAYWLFMKLFKQNKKFKKIQNINIGE